MAQKGINQEHSKKFRRNAPVTDLDQPSKAPLQDEDGKDRVGSSAIRRHQVDTNSAEQGISNRPVKEEHAFPDSDTPRSDAPDVVEGEPKQSGGNRGGV
jgi:hypothetical protein